MPTNPTPIIAVTAGDPAGIGPDVALQAVADKRVRSRCRGLLIGHPEVFHRAAELRPTVGELADIDLAPSANRQDLQQALESCGAGRIPVLNPVADAVLDIEAGHVSAIAGDAAFLCLTTAIEMATSGAVDAIATAPLNKMSLHAAGHDFPGHTEILADRCGVDDFAMMLHLPESRLQPLRSLVAPGAATSTERRGLSVAHVTLHTSIASVPKLLTTSEIVQTTHLMDGFLERLGTTRRAIAVAALNPHGGEGGLFGDEESRVIEPAVVEARAAGCNVTGPLPVDTLMRRAVAGEFDGVIAMYHDQGHIPIKLIGFDSAINITLGLPIVRTSPTHGTAFDRAWNPVTPADPSGMVEAILMAAELSR